MKTTSFFTRVSLVNLFVLIVLSGVITSCSSDSTSTTPEPTVYAVDAKPYGKTYTEWSAAWWQWAFQTPVHQASDPKIITHPLRDSTGKYAEYGQSAGSSVFFLGGWIYGSGTINRTVTIPSSKAIFVPLINFQSDTTGNWTRDSVVNAINGAEALPVVLSATLDGNTIANLPSYKVRSNDFSVVLPADNVYQFIGLTFPAGRIINPMISSGYWLMFSPMSKGSHTLHFTASVAAAGITQDITYNITVN